MSLVRFTLTAPAPGATFARIEDAYHDLGAFIERLRAKKIDVQHFEAVVRHHDRLAAVKPAAGQGAGGDNHMNLRANRIYLRALLLDLLDQETAWQAEQDAKDAAKAAYAEARKHMNHPTMTKEDGVIRINGKPASSAITEVLKASKP